MAMNYLKEVDEIRIPFHPLQRPMSGVETDQIVRVRLGQHGNPWKVCLTNISSRWGRQATDVVVGQADELEDHIVIDVSPRERLTTLHEIVFID